MCQTIAGVRYEKCNHTVEMNVGKNAPFCLLGEQCKEVGYAYKVFRRQGGQCPNVSNFRCYFSLGLVPGF